MAGIHEPLIDRQVVLEVLLAGDMTTWSYLMHEPLEEIPQFIMGLLSGRCGNARSRAGVFLYEADQCQGLGIVDHHMQSWWRWVNREKSSLTRCRYSRVSSARRQFQLGALEGIVEALGDLEKLLAAMEDSPASIEAHIVHEHHQRIQNLGDAATLVRGIEVDTMCLP